MDNILFIGPAKAESLQNSYGITTITELRKEVKKNPSILTAAQTLALKWHSKISGKRAWEEIHKHVLKIKSIIKKGVIIAGSYRRNSPLIGDIDILVPFANYQQYIDKLHTSDYIVEIFSHGPAKHTAIGCVGSSYRKIDIIPYKTENKPFMLAYFTGDFIENIRLRNKAIKMGYSLSQYGIKNINTGKYVQGITTERGIYDFLQIPYKTPWNRTNQYDTNKK
jgi:DNA polymerase/3'-5' exonuclease PolX